MTRKSAENDKIRLLPYPCMSQAFITQLIFQGFGLPILSFFCFDHLGTLECVTKLQNVEGDNLSIKWNRESVHRGVMGVI